MDEAVNSVTRLPTIVKSDENRTVVSIIENVITAYFPGLATSELIASFLTVFFLMFDIKLPYLS